MFETLYEMLVSKKFIVAIAGVIVAAAAKIGLDLDTESVALILSPIIAFILGQGVADSGKAAAKVTALADASSEKERADIKAS